MKLFFKHLLRDALRFPLQVILIILTLTFSVTVGVGAFKTQEMFIERAFWLESTGTRLGDIVITPGASDMRMIFDSDVESLLGEGDRMFGEFRISALTRDASNSDTVISVSGADLESADTYFESEYAEYGIFTTENLTSSAIISENAAKELGKGIGDSISLSFLNQELIFTVQAIAKSNGIFEECDLMIPIETLQRVLAKHVPSIAVMGKAFTPYTRIMLRLGESSDAASFLQKINQNESLKHCGVELCAVSSTVTDMRILSQTGSIFLISSVIIILCAMLCLTSLRLLEDKRRQDYALFSACGATDSQINAMRVSESLFYSLIASAVGIPLSKNIVVWVASLITRPDTEVTVGADGVAFGLLLSVVLSVSCTIIHIIKLRSSSQSEKLAFEDRERKKSRWLAPLLLFVIASLLAAALLVKPDYKPVFCIALIFTLVLFALLYTPAVEKKLASLFSKALLCKKARLGKEALVFRAIENNYALRHLCMILTVSLTLIISISFCQSSATEMISLLNSGVQFDHIVMNSDSSVASHIKDNYSTTKLCEMKVFTDAVLEKDSVVIAISAYGDRDSLFGDELEYGFPTGNKIILSRSLAKLCSVKKGDTVSLTLHGQEYMLEVSEIFSYKALAVFFDAKALGIRPDMCAFDLADTEGPSSLESLREELELNGATLTTSSAVFGRSGKTGLAFSLIVENSLYAAVILTLIGTVNSVISIYRRRRGEFYILSLCGMSRAQIASRVLCELFCTFLLSALLSLPLTVLSFVALEIGASSFGLTLL